MKKYLKIILYVSSLFLFMTCENSINADYQGNSFNGNTKQNGSRNARQGFDLKPYIDASSKNINAADLTVYDFEELCEGEYKCCNSTLRINKKEHTISLRNPDTTVRGIKYQNVFAKYEYKMIAAGENLLYICPVSNKTAEFSSNSVKLDCDSVSPFALYVSFYGFGEGRIEVSLFLNDESIMQGDQFC